MTIGQFGKQFMEFNKEHAFISSVAKESSYPSNSSPVLVSHLVTGSTTQAPQSSQGNKVVKWYRGKERKVVGVG